jgi:integrase
MARQPKPWYWEARDAWYVQINGKQIKLHQNQKKADREFYRIIAADGKLDRKQAERMTVADACEAYIASSQHLRVGTLRGYNEKLGALAHAFGSRRLDSIKPTEVIQWVSNYQSTQEGRSIGDSTRAVYFGYAKQLFSWCRDTGLIDLNPFARIKSPWRVSKRTEPMSEEDYEKVMSMPKAYDQFKEVVEFVWRTGIRPGELAILSARHMDARLPIARFQPTGHQTGSRTGLQREVYSLLTYGRGSRRTPRHASKDRCCVSRTEHRGPRKTSATGTVGPGGGSGSMACSIKPGTDEL